MKPALTNLIKQRAEYESKRVTYPEGFPALLSAVRYADPHLLLQSKTFIFGESWLFVKVTFEDELFHWSDARQASASRHI